MATVTVEVVVVEEAGAVEAAVTAVVAGGDETTGFVAVTGVLPP